MSDWLANTIARAEDVDDWLSPRRRKSLDLLRGTKWPTRKTEAWKYTPVKAIERARLSPLTNRSDAFADSGSEAGLESCLAGVIANSIDITFNNGVLQTELSDCDLPPGVAISSLNKTPSKKQAWAADSFAAIKPCRKSVV